MIALESIGHVAVLINLKDFRFHQGSSLNLKSILDAEFIADEKESKEGRQIVWFITLDLW